MLASSLKITIIIIIIIINKMCKYRNEHKIITDNDMKNTGKRQSKIKEKKLTRRLTKLGQGNYKIIVTISFFEKLCLCGVLVDRLH